jgi:FKBP-type peptidyl-prolyl cis-trans isomerase
MKHCSPQPMIGSRVPSSQLGVFLLLLAAVGQSLAQSPAGPPTADDAAYVVGLNMGQQLRQNGVTNELPTDRIVEGMKAALAGKKASPADQRQLQSFLGALSDAAAAKNALLAEKFLASNGRDKAIKTTASGLQYRIVDPGRSNAASPLPIDRVTVEYRGTLIDGTEFDASARHPSGGPLAVNNLIKGWQEALVQMKPGAQWQLFVPPQLGYGAAARPGIPGNSLLIFDLELKTIQKSPTSINGR